VVEWIAELYGSNCLQTVVQPVIVIDADEDFATLQRTYRLNSFYNYICVFKRRKIQILYAGGWPKLCGG
jgi:hypothetical protein